MIVKNSCRLNLLQNCSVKLKKPIINFTRKSNLNFIYFFVRMEKDLSPQVIIIGAGLSGLSAADYILSQNPNVKITILEAMDRIGGRTITQEIKGVKFDMGAQFIGKNQKYVIKLANRAQQQFIPQIYRGAKVLYLNGQRSTYTSNIPNNVNIVVLLQMQFCIWKINRMANKVPLDNPRNCQMANYWDSMTLQTWIYKNVWSEKVRLLFQCAIRVVLGCQLSQISFLYFLWFVHQNDSFDNLVNIENGLQQKKLRNGTQQLSFFLQKQIEKRGGKIILEQKVEEIIQHKGIVHIKTMQNKQFQCDSLIMATPPSVFRNINFIPNLSAQKKHMSQKSFMGQLTKVVILYDKQYWKQKGYSGEIVSDCFDSPILSCFDDTKLSSNGEILQPALIVFVGSQVYRYWKQKQNMAEQITQKVSEAFQCDQLKRPLAVQWYQFDEQKTIGGGPVCIMGPGTLSHIQNLRKNQGNIHFAGTQTANVSVGYMDGAIQSGIRAGKQVLQRIADPQISCQTDVQPVEKQNSPWYNEFIRSPIRFFEWW